ncbi:Lrp/AsnC family transcriptional regulator [Bergeyella cardium]|uniref:AsnC family transcriptional regulator n=1 Tax=Bergeyella cardium TaxID=1585976 RepID=A0A6P1QZ49_9FLAO|nr:Lrp/AsnC family transcriptional regulator [Bergeyella cardium]QHN65964.1 AsnC family transcriptional regulator [Bergeyella cardium]WHE33568.1 Lrp/AsnC family transcriptional regulator [Bergeyella cardium]WHF60218.1 Lrp/AsnC family transcriptional regulator [Bergeyella cardium]
MKTLDSIDLQILDILQRNFSTPIKELSERVGLSFTPTYERIKALKKSGLILRNVAVVDREALGYNIISYCYVTLKEQSIDRIREFETKASEKQQILEVIRLSGQYDYMMKIVAKDINDYNNFMMKIIAELPNIGNYSSSIVLSVVKSETRIPVTNQEKE